MNIQNRIYMTVITMMALLLMIYISSQNPSFSLASSKVYEIASVSEVTSVPELTSVSEFTPVSDIGSDTFETTSDTAENATDTAENASGIMSTIVSSSPEAGTDLPNEEDNEYENLAIAHVTNYVNVRQEPSTESRIVGRIYNGAAAMILETAGEDGDWFKITSGNVEGYIKSEFFYYGKEAADRIDQYITRYAVVIADRLNVRESPDISSKRIGYVDNGEKVSITDSLEGWYQVQYMSQKKGYVSADFVTVTEEFVYAKTLEEIQAEEEAQRKLEERMRANEEQYAENTTIIVQPPTGNYNSNSELRSSIVDFAMQFLGNKYVHGGNSLVNGTDCSGFTSLIYAEFGYSISRTPSGQLSNAGRSIDYSEIQPGDIICYGKSKCTHVALYIGNGQIIHEANSKKGVVIYNADYDNILGVKNVID